MGVVAALDPRALTAGGGSAKLFMLPGGASPRDSQALRGIDRVWGDTERQAAMCRLSCLRR